MLIYVQQLIIQAYQILHHLRKEIIEGVDMLMVRELTGGIYFGKPSERVEVNGKEAVVDTLYYEKEEMKRVIRQAFELASNKKEKSNFG